MIHTHFSPKCVERKKKKPTQKIQGKAASKQRWKTPQGYETLAGGSTVWWRDLPWCLAYGAEIVTSFSIWPGRGRAEIIITKWQGYTKFSPLGGEAVTAWCRDACATQQSGWTGTRLGAGMAPFWAHQFPTAPAGKKHFPDASSPQRLKTQLCQAVGFCKQPQHPALLLALTAQGRKQISGCSLTLGQPESWKWKRTRSRFIID